MYSSALITAHVFAKSDAIVSVMVRWLKGSKKKRDVIEGYKRGYKTLFYK